MFQDTLFPERVISDWVNKKILNEYKPIILGLSAPQGAGKTTITKALKEEWEEKIAVLCLDDFYLTLAERKDFADTISPLFETRGPPGTHDLDMLNAMIDQLLSATDETAIKTPQFDKVADDRKGEGLWLAHKGRPKIILLEGWCVGGLAAPDFVLGDPVNDVEVRDLDNKWRSHVGQQLQGAYLSLWERCDDIFYMLAQDFSQVPQWRMEQEETNLGLRKGDLPLERQEWVGEFVQYFQRITEGIMQGYRCDGEVVYIDAERKLIKHSKR